MAWPNLPPEHGVKCEGMLHEGRCYEKMRAELGGRFNSEGEFIPSGEEDGDAETNEALMSQEDSQGMDEESLTWTEAQGTFVNEEAMELFPEWRRLETQLSPSMPCKSMQFKENLKLNTSWSIH